MELVAPQVGMDPKTNRDELVFLIDRAQEMAYNKGTWWGMYKELSMRTTNNEVFLPYPYTNLISVNINGRPKLKRGVHYQFHQNGYGSIEECYNKRRGNWLTDVVDSGEYPLPFQPDYHKLQVRARTKEADGSAVTISGDNADGQVLTYIYDEKEAREQNIIGRPFSDCSICTTEDESDRLQYTKTVFGEVVPLEGRDVIYATSNFFTRVDSITKTPTLGPVDIYIDRKNHAEHVVTLQPEQTESVFRRYMLPDSCEEMRTVHVLAKLGEPSPLTHDNQELMIKSKMGLIYLAMWAFYEFKKMDRGSAQQYLEQGILALDEQNTENTGHNVQPIQVVNPETEVSHLYGFQ